MTDFDFLFKHFLEEMDKSTDWFLKSLKYPKGYDKDIADLFHKKHYSKAMEYLKQANQLI